MALTDGSSPRVRGKRTWPRSRWARSRIIPARAGQTLTSRTGDAKGPDHPRACGANISLQMSRTMPHGSSPRVRGKPVGAATVRVRRRIIPARAGQTTSITLTVKRDTDHPRACGANGRHRPGHRTQRGSSPRVRGKRPSGKHGITHPRIIPARAGQTGHRRPRAGREPDHPRACGANEWVWRSYLHTRGSSPRVRGKQSDFMRKLLSAGPSIIGFAQWLQSSCYCSCFQSSAKTPISRGTTPTSLFLGFQNSITLLLLT